MMNTLTLLLLALSLPSGCTGQSMESIPSSLVVKQPGQILSLSCRGSGFNFGCCGMHWIRQAAGKPLEWMGVGFSDPSSNRYASSVSGRAVISREDSNSMVHLRLNNLQPEDSAVYYCARDYRLGYFDYWGSGTKVTVSSGATVKPTVYPLVQCDSASGDKITLGCLARDFSPDSVTFEWTRGGNKLTDQFVSVQSNNDKFTGVSVINVMRSDWNSFAEYACSVTHPGGNGNVKVQKEQTAEPTTNQPETTAEPDLPEPEQPAKTAKLNLPSPSDIINNNQADLECVATGRDQTTVYGTEITWSINGRGVTENSVMYSKTSKLSRSYSEWQNVNSVSCSVEGVPVSEQISRGNVKDTNVTVHVLQNITSSSEVTLVCLVSSSVLPKFSISWRVDSAYTDGINFPAQRDKSKRGFLVTSVYTTTKELWKQNTVFNCVVRFDDENLTTKIEPVSSKESNIAFALSCTDGSTDEDELSSLWLTTSTFIFLFIFSLSYSMIFSLVKMK